MKLIECGEPLVDVGRACPGFVIRLGKEDGRERRAYLRKSVVIMLGKAQRLLPKGMTFIIRDAWRSREEQERIHDEFIERFSRLHPSWTAKRVEAEVAKYVMPASGSEISGHMTGGAVDLRLWKNGKRVPMRSWKLTYQENAEPYQPKLPRHLQANREIMYAALRTVGLTQCHNEFWHWSYGDAQWAKRTGGKTAKYGVISVSGSLPDR